MAGATLITRWEPRRIGKTIHLFDRQQPQQMHFARPEAVPEITADALCGRTFDLAGTTVASVEEVFDLGTCRTCMRAYMARSGEQIS